MNDLGLTLAWLAVQAALVLVPALALHALASRHGPAAGAWVATLSLGLVAALNVAAVLPGIGLNVPARVKSTPPVASAHAAVGTTNEPDRGAADGSHPRADATGRRGFPGLRLAWARFERGTAEPVARCRPLGGTLAAVALAGTGVGLLRLALGLWAIGLCRRRGRNVVDPELTGLVDELRAAMGYRRPVELREVLDLTTPATAGWRRPVLLLPDDWRSWDDAERRAVVAHELAHVVRADYAAGLVARLAVVLNPFHPLVLWTANRLQLQQELAADALGARFAGGRARYLVALSRLALRQDGRSPCWPARAFLPARGTLIRRIAMLRDETVTEPVDRPWSKPRRLLTALGLLGLTATVATLRGPARGDGGDPPANPPQASTPSARTEEPNKGEALPLFSIPDDAMGVVTFRPAAAFRRPGMKPLADLVDATVIKEFELEYAKAVGIDPKAPGLPRIKTADVEWIGCGFHFDKAPQKQGEKELHRIVFHAASIRTTRPFDWVKFLRAWGVKTTEARENGVAYHTFDLPLVGPTSSGIYCPDDRTLVFDDANKIRSMIRRGTKSAPAFLQNADWERAGRGLFALAVNNQGGSFAKRYDLGRTDDAVVLSFLQGVDRWVFGIDDADALAVHGVAALSRPGTGEALARAIEALVKTGRTTLESVDPAVLTVAHHERGYRMAKAFLSGLRVRPTERSVELKTDGFGTPADLASYLAAEAACETKSDQGVKKTGLNNPPR